MKLSSVIKDIKCELEGKDVEISTIDHNSKNVKSGSLFVCLSGKTDSGENYINEALENGAVAIMINEEFFANNKLMKKRVMNNNFS